MQQAIPAPLERSTLDHGQVILEHGQECVPCLEQLHPDSTPCRRPPGLPASSLACHLTVTRHGLKAAWTFTLGGWEEWEGPSAVGEVFPRVRLPVRPE